MLSIKMLRWTFVKSVANFLDVFIAEAEEDFHGIRC